MAKTFSPAGGFIAHFNAVQKEADSLAMYRAPQGDNYYVKELMEVDDFIILVSCSRKDLSGKVISKTFFGNISNFVFEF